METNPSIGRASTMTLANGISNRTRSSLQNLRPTKPESLHRLVICWFSANSRRFPWRDTENPFHVLIAEVLLRQTQAQRVVGPYMELITRYPNPEALASADVEELRAWFRPLGLVRRADNLVRTAQAITENYGGAIPNDLGAVLSLRGIGTYGARAILCLSFGERVPMIDESSGRLLRRMFGLAFRGPAYNDRDLLRQASELLPQKSVKEFNLGLLDIAARFCHAREPDCNACPLLEACVYASSRRD